MPSNTRVGAVGGFVASRHGVLTRRQASSFGLSSRTIRQLLTEGVLSEPCAGVLVVTSAPPTWRQSLEVVTRSCRAVGVAGFESSAALRVWDSFVEGPLVLSLPSPRKLPIIGAVGHVGPLDPCDIDEVDGIRCTTACRTLCDLGSVVSPFRVRLAFESFWRSGGDLDELRRTADRLHRPGQHGTTVIRELLAEVPFRRVPTESALEVAVERVLDEIPGFIRQHEVHDESGRFVARVDFAIPSIRVAVEAHSKQFHETDLAHQSDVARHRDLVANAWRVRYVLAEETNDPERLRRSIERFVASTDPGQVPRWPASA